MLQLTLSSDSPTPLVDQIVTAVRTRIDDRILRPGARLPPIRQFAEHHRVSRFTVVEAYDRLVAVGYLQSRRGSGFYVASRAQPARAIGGGDAVERAIDASWLMREMANGDPERILAGSGSLPAAWLDEAGVLRALRGLTRRADVRPVSYGSAQGYAPLRAQLQVRLAEIGIGATPEQIVLTYGVHQALDIVCRYFLKPGDCVLVDDPGYWNLFGNLRLYGVALIGVPRTPDGPDTAALEAILAEHQPRLFFTHSVLHNPTACNLSPAVAFRVLQLAEKHDFMIVEDDIYGDIAPDAATRLAGLDQLSRVIYTSSFSKTISGNLRVGFLACRPDLAHLFTDVKIVSMMSSAELAEQLVHQLLTDGHYRKLLDRLKGRLAESTGQALRMLERVGLKPDPEPRGGPFVWARVPGLTDTADLARSATRENILLAPGNVFRPQNQPSGFLRLNVGFCGDARLERFLTAAIDAGRH
ncbi:MAG: PLP-dependent aminotransferase family protein [Zoogloea sp.]|nr:PLP-dependent aminotransferase family protein [Zoogloea sp.]